MTEEECREIARDLMVNATDIEYMDIFEEVEMEYDSDDPEADAQAIHKLITTAKVTVTWEEKWITEPSPQMRFDTPPVGTVIGW